MSSLKILIPTDFSQQADFAWLMAKKLGEKIPVEVQFIHVLSPGQGVITDSEGRPVEGGDVDPGFFAEMEKMAKEKLQLLHRKTSAAVNLKTGILNDEIIDFAEKGNFNLIVMGTKGATGLKEFFSGSETQQIVRHSTVPVLSMMCDRSDLQIRNILLVHDFENQKQEQLYLLRAISQAWGAKVHLLYVQKGNEDVVGIKQKMQQFAVANALENFEVHVHHDNSVEAGVIHFNQMHDMDLICIGTHGYTGIRHLIRGSVAESLINHLFKPIITYHLN